MSKVAMVEFQRNETVPRYIRPTWNLPYDEAEHSVRATKRRSHLQELRRVSQEHIRERASSSAPWPKAALDEKKTHHVSDTLPVPDRDPAPSPFQNVKTSFKERMRALPKAMADLVERTQPRIMLECKAYPCHISHAQSAHSDDDDDSSIFASFDEVGNEGNTNDDDNNNHFQPLSDDDSIPPPPPPLPLE